MARSFRFLRSLALLAGVLAASPLSAQTLSNNCNGCTIEYTYDASTCSLTRSIDCNNVPTCWDLPGFDDDTCRDEGSSVQNGIGSVTTRIDGDAELKPCMDGTCGSTGSDCTISYYRPEAKPDVSPGDTASGQEGPNVLTPGTAWACQWTGTQLVYTITNLEPVAKTVTWGGTTIVTVPLPALGQVVRQEPLTTAPSASFQPLIVHTVGGGTTTISVVTYLASAPVPGLPGPYLLLLLFGGGAILILVLRGRA